MLFRSACSSKSTPPKEAIQQAFTASMEMKSYSFTGSIGIDELELPEELLAGADPSMIDMIKNASLNVKGAYREDPMQMEMNLDLTIPGDMAMTINVPIVMTEEKLYVKIPNIPMLPLGEAAGKFVEIDPKQLAEEQGVEAPVLDLNTQRQMAEELTGIALKHFDGKTYFAELKKEDVTDLPEGVDPDRIVKFFVTQETFEPMIMTIVDKVAPEIIDALLANEDYLKALQLTKEDLEKAKEELAAGDRSELKTELEKFKEDVKVNDLSLTTAIQGDYPVYQSANVNLDVTQDGQTAKVGLSFKSQYANINEEVTFEHGIPEDAISIEELEQMFMAPAL